MATMKDILADVKKCTKEGNSQSKCIDAVAKEYNLDKTDIAQLKRMID